MAKLFKNFKRIFYFYAAAYFALWAKIVMDRWRPQVIVVTGSSGKTTLLHLLESQFGDEAVYSHGANSAFGIPFHILGLKRVTYGLLEWPLLFFKAPFMAFRPAPKQRYYVAEADAERPGEAEFVSRLLKTDIAIWLSLGQAHGASYDRLVRQKRFVTVLDAIAYEYGYVVSSARSLVIVNGDSPHITGQMSRCAAKKETVSASRLKQYSPSADKTTFIFNEIAYTIPAFVPRDTAYAIEAIAALCRELGRAIDKDFKGFYLPPGRSSVFSGIRGTTLVDSSYNATAEGMRAMLDAFAAFPAPRKWLVLGDMLEQGVNEVDEHARLADLILKADAERVVLLGPRVVEYTLPILSKKMGQGRAVGFEMPADALGYLEKELQGGEAILFKGARLFEGLVEKLLARPEDAAQLCRREKVWVERRRRWGI